jgi:NhaA family Na+:H+ antiporter
MKTKPNLSVHPLFETGEVIGELFLKPFNRFASMQAASSVLLFLLTTIALIWSNSGLAGSYEWLKHLHLELRIGDCSLDKSLHFWINDGLMTIFFFLVGLEIKNEMLVGELASLRQASLPLAGALGGMIVPAGIYYMFNAQTPTANGWAIPMATDIAFIMAAFTILGSRVPHSLKVSFAALAIVDDIGAVAVIATFYTSALALYYLFVALLCLLALILFNVLGYRRPLPYVIVGVFVWWAFYMSGVHSTIAGILVAFTIPARSRRNMLQFRDRLIGITDRLKRMNEQEVGNKADEDSQAMIRKIENLCQDAQTPLQRIEHCLQPWVVFMIVPLFALANAGVSVNLDRIFDLLGNPLSLGITMGLVIGKQLGIATASWAAIKTGFAVMPSGVSFGQIYGASILCGIGFTMSIFLADLAFGESPSLDCAKISILLASSLCFVIGLIALYIASYRKTEEGNKEIVMIQT